jgi:hypothetical protein
MKLHATSASPFGTHIVYLTRGLARVRNCGIEGTFECTTVPSIANLHPASLSHLRPPEAAPPRQRPLHTTRRRSPTKPAHRHPVVASWEMDCRFEHCATTIPPCSKGWRAGSGQVETLLADPAAYRAAFTRRGDPLLRASPFLGVRTRPARDHSDVEAATFVPRWSGRQQRVALFDAHARRGHGLPQPYRTGIP